MTDFLDLPDGRRIAYRLTQGTGPAIVFLPGYMSDMAGSKASALFASKAAPACCSTIRAAANRPAILPKARSRAGATKRWP